MVLARSLKSFYAAFCDIINVTAPFYIIGAVLGLMVAGQTTNLYDVMIGFTMLPGLNYKNAILLMVD